MTTPSMGDAAARNLLGDAYRAAVDAVLPARVIAGVRFPPPPVGRTIVVGAGKAAIGMACALEAVWPVPIEGLVIAPDGPVCDLLPLDIDVRRAGHPIPDERGVAATVELLALLEGAGPHDQVIALWSGGGSALLSSSEGITFAEKQELVGQLLRSGADITSINIVRKHLSRVKGGQLARVAAPAPLLALALSDVVGDDLSIIASGPTVPDSSTFADALAVLDRFRVDSPAARSSLRSGARGERPETPKPGDPVFDRVETRIIGSNRLALRAAVNSLHGTGIMADVASDRVTGPARAAASRDANRARVLEPAHGVMTGGECTVKVEGRGRGGRNLEYLLALAIELDGHPGVYALAADTDGIDGTSDAAGALLTPSTLERARTMGLDPGAFLAANDAHGFFDRLGDLLRVGETGTNVNDIHILIRL